MQTVSGVIKEYSRLDYVENLKNLTASMNVSKLFEQVKSVELDTCLLLKLASAGLVTFSVAYIGYLNY